MDEIGRVRVTARPGGARAREVPPLRCPRSQNSPCYTGPRADPPSRERLLRRACGLSCRARGRAEGHHALGACDPLEEADGKSIPTRALIENSAVANPEERRAVCGGGRGRGASGLARPRRKGATCACAAGVLKLGRAVVDGDPGGSASATQGPQRGP
jgi:hypothetical protein